MYYSNARGAISAAVFPDLYHVGHDSVLRAALYFENIYADCLQYVITRTGAPKKESSWVRAKFRVFSSVSEREDLRDLVTAGVIAPLRAAKQLIAFKPLSLRDFSPTLIEKVTNSLRASTTIGPEAIVALEFGSTPPRRQIIKDPTDLRDPDAFLAAQLHLFSVVMMLHVCENRKATPLTDHEAHTSLLVELANSFPTIARMLGMEESLSLGTTRDTVAIRILEETLPAVQVRKPSDILELREEMQDELSSFRAEVGKLSTMIESQPWEPGFRQEVDRIVAREVKPAFHALRRRLQDPTKRMLSHLVADWKSIATSAAVPLAALVLKGAPLPLSILAGLCSGVGIAALKTKVEEWSAKRNSTLTFLVEARKRLEG